MPAALAAGIRQPILCSPKQGIPDQTQGDDTGLGGNPLARCGARWRTWAS